MFAAEVFLYLLLSQALASLLAEKAGMAGKAGSHRNRTGGGAMQEGV